MLFRSFISPFCSVRDLQATMEHLCTKPMQPARYFCTGLTEGIEEWHHYALNFDLYGVGFRGFGISGVRSLVSGVISIYSPVR